MGSMKDLLGDTPYVYPAAPGWKESTTSRAAAAAVGDRSPKLRDEALRAITQSAAGLTADEVATMMNETVLAVRPRVSELVKMEKIVSAGTRRKNASGQSAKVWIDKARAPE